jgi:acetylornithine deacetylase
MSIQDIKAQLAALVGFDTTSRNSNLSLIAHVEAALAGPGVRIERIGGSHPGKSNLLVTVGPADAPGYILSGHCDTVPVDGQDWTSDPFRLVERDGRLYGRGTCDMKGFLAVCIAMVPRMLEAPLARPIQIAISYDEEVGCVGVRSVIEHLASSAVRPLGCFVGEPTGMDVVIGHKGKRAMRVTVRGAACHSSLAPHGVNAIEHAARLVERVRTLADEMRARGMRDDLYDVPHSTGLTGVIHGGTMVNIVPETCVMEFEFRTLEGDDPDALVRNVVDFARNVVEPEMRRIAPEAGITFEETISYPGLDTPPEDEIVTLVKKLAGRNDHSKVAYGTEGGLFRKAANIPTVVIGPGSIEQAHKPDEYIEISQLSACASFIEALISHCRA